MFLSFVALGGGAAIYASRLQNALRKRAWGGLPSAEVSWDDARTILTVTVGEASVLLATMEAPIPGFAESCASAMFWPAHRPTAHATHVILTLLAGEDGDEWDDHALDGAILLTHVTEALVQTCGEPVGVIWMPSGVILPPDRFLEVAAELRDGEPLARLWVRYEVRPTGPDSADGRTIGLSAFGLLEIEASDAAEPADELLARLLGLATYLLTHGPVIEDGHTVGQSADERIRVEYGPSVLSDDDDEVMHLEYEDDGGGIEEY